MPTKSNILALDIALRRNRWFEHLPEIDSQLVHKLYYDTLCAMCSIRITSSGKVDAHAEGKMLELLKARGAQYPAEHSTWVIYMRPRRACSSSIARTIPPTA